MGNFFATKPPVPQMEVKRAGKSSLEMPDKILGLDFIGSFDQINMSMIVYVFLGYPPNL